MTSLAVAFWASSTWAWSFLFSLGCVVLFIVFLFGIISGAFNCIFSLLAVLINNVVFNLVEVKPYSNFFSFFLGQFSILVDVLVDKVCNLVLVLFSDSTFF